MGTQLPGLKPNKLLRRSDFNPKDFRLLIWERGRPVDWEMASSCPCRRNLIVGGKSGDTEEPKVDCTACNGTGIIHHSKQSIHALINRARHDEYERFEAWSEYDPGLVRFTLLPEHTPNHLDRLTLTDTVLAFRETRTRTANTVESVRFPIVRRTITLGTHADPTAEQTKTIGVLYMRKAKEDGTLYGGELEEGTDFEVDSNGDIDWTKGDTAGSAPLEGELYGFQHYAHPRYIVLDYYYGHRDTYVKFKHPSETLERLPVRVEARLEWLGNEGTV